MWSFRLTATTVASLVAVHAAPASAQSTAPTCELWAEEGTIAPGVVLETRHCKWDKTNERVWFRARNKINTAVRVDASVYKSAGVNCASPGKAELAGYLGASNLAPQAATSPDFSIVPIGAKLTPCAKVQQVGGSAATRAPASGPDLRNIKLPNECVALLKSQAARLDAAGYTKKLFAWTPLILLAGETSAPHMAFSIATTDWEELARGLRSVDKLAFSVLATEALVHARNHEGEPKIAEFWQEMSDAYAAQLNRK